ncbi:hypothetical protein [Sulfuracidifex tepidarius]|uniref:Uncharacterized protein n=1 Tax=Sulfuracidifex tepidarius TaxID=1294262 RepID=A0A510DZQ7_9CREN|nr:hypothetical protein [Sulfuracidifex tepidarius]BBG22970.1 hypothetical protein IC006_0254 [Sulfuracidifex tepidarius]BBG25731.1 hypothetical protein IC007_0236 [Sulfuracidifex tepidarius]
MVEAKIEDPCIQECLVNKDGKWGSTVTLTECLQRCKGFQIVKP